MESRIEVTVSTQDDKTIAWQGRIQERAAHAAKAILDRLAAMPKSGFASLTPAERKDVHELVAKQVVDTMATLGTFVTAGAQDFQVCNLEGVTINKDKIALKLIPATTESGGINLQMLAANAGKQVVVAMVNGLAYTQAREALSKAIHREQTDWVQRSQDADMTEAEQLEARQAEQPTEATPEQIAESFPPGDTEQQQPGELIADQPGDGDGEASPQDQTPSASEEGGADTGNGASDGPGSGPVQAADEGTEGAVSRRDSPLARAGRRVRRSAGGGDRPAAH